MQSALHYANGGDQYEVYKVIQSHKTYHIASRGMRCALSGEVSEARRVFPVNAAWTAPSEDARPAGAKTVEYTE